MNLPKAPKCPKCGKSVYFAEKQLYQGQDYHNQCVWALTKEQEAVRGTPVFSIAEQIHCNPDDKKPWAGGYDGGQSGIPVASGGSAPKVGGKFCPNCGVKLDDAAKFCAGCGNKL